MPAAVPFQQGIIGLYNNSNSPGVYISWDPSNNINTAFSAVFKGPSYTNYRFPLIINNYKINGTLNKLDTPISLGVGVTYVYALTQSKLIAYQKNSDYYSTIAAIDASSLTGIYPSALKVKTINNSDYLFLSYPNNNYFAVALFSGSGFSTSQIFNYSAISPASGSYAVSDFAISNSNFYFAYQSNVYLTPFNGVGNTFIFSTSSSIINNGNTLSTIANYNDQRIAVVDNNNIIYEYLNYGPTGIGNTLGPWQLNYSIPNLKSYVWGGVIYNHFGVIVATDKFNNTVNVIASGKNTVATQNYMSLGDFQYQLVNTSFTTSIQGNILNTVGGPGVAYLQFDTPNCLLEDQEYNIVVGDLNNRLTYIPTQLNYIGLVEAPLNELIDTSGNPADIYYVKQINIDYSQLVSLPPFTGDELLLKSSVLYELNSLLRVPIYDEEPLYDYKRQSATLAYGDIITDPAPVVRITVSTNGGQNSSMFVLSPFSQLNTTLDQSTADPFDVNNPINNYPNGIYYRFTNDGKIYFIDYYNNPLSIQEYDTILVSYYVKLFTNTQINNALYLALQAINAQPGLNKIYSVRDTPFYYDQTIVSGATYYLLRQLLVGLNQRERRLLVQDPESGSFDAIGNIRETAKMYQEEFNELLKQLPIAKRPTLGTITVPEYSLPGGRSRLFRQIWSGAQGG